MTILRSLAREFQFFFPRTKSGQERFRWFVLTLQAILVPIHGRWSCLPLAFGFYLRRLTLRGGCIRLRRKALVFADKFAQAVVLIARLGACFMQCPVLVVTDSWFGNNGLFQPLRQQLGARAHLLSRLRVNATLYARPDPTPGKAGRPRKYGARLGSARELAAGQRLHANPQSRRGRQSPALLHGGDHHHLDLRSASRTRSGQTLRFGEHHRIRLRRCPTIPRPAPRA
jgi:hypothetical protein